MEASHFVHTIETRQGLKIACLEEIGFKKGWLSKKKLVESVKALNKTGYGQYLDQLANQ